VVEVVELIVFFQVAVEHGEKLRATGPLAKWQIRQLSCQSRYMAKQVAIVALEGILDSVFGITVDILSVANRIAVGRGGSPHFDVRIVSAGAEVRSGSGRRLESDATFRTTTVFDIVLVPGLNVPSREEIEARLATDEALAAQRFLRRQASHGALIGAACAGTFILAETGLLDGGVATTSWWLAPVFRARYPRIELHEESVVVPTGPRLVTAGAAMAQIDLTLWLVRRVAGPDVASLCARLLVLDERPSQARYAMVNHLDHDSEEVRRAERYVRQHLQRPLSIAEIAKAARVSPRTLARRLHEATGVSPVGFVQRLRVERAVHLLGTTKLSFDEVARRVGYEDPGALRGLLKRDLGVTARGLRGSRAG
jgi:transcriptional regulator GlxA family with amidase domain